jgi:hypothetical protein
MFAGTRGRTVMPRCRSMHKTMRARFLGSGCGMGPPGGGSVCSWAGAGESELGRDKGFRPTNVQCFTFLFLFLCSNLIQICFFHLFKLGLYAQTKPSMTCSKAILLSYILFI